MVKKNPHHEKAVYETTRKAQLEQDLRNLQVGRHDQAGINRLKDAIKKR